MINYAFVPIFFAHIYNFCRSQAFVHKNCIIHKNATKGAIVLVMYAITALIYASVALYLVGNLYFANTNQNSTRPSHRWGLMAVLLVGLLCHTYLLAPHIITPMGLSFGLYNTISLVSVFLLLYFVVFNVYHPITSLGVLAIPTALVGLGANYIGRLDNTSIIQADLILKIHIFLSFASYCMLFMAAIQALIVRLQIRELKHQSFHRFWVNQLPPLQSMDALLFEMILIGFALLTIALGFGAMIATDILGQHIAHKTFFSVLSWLVFGGLIVGHYRHGWQGRRMASMTLIGFGLLAIGFIGSKFVFEILLRH